MLQGYRAFAMGAEDLPRVQPLLNLVQGAGDLVPWLFTDHGSPRLASQEEKAGRGALLVKRTDGYVAALFCYQVMTSPHSRTLDCPVVVLPDLLRSHRVLNLLLDEAERLGRRHDCRQLRLALSFFDEPPPVAAGPLGRAVRARGFAYQSVLYAKDINPEAADASGFRGIGGDR